MPFKLHCCYLKSSLNYFKHHLKSGPVSWTWGESVFFHIFLKRFSSDVVLNLLLHISKAHETFEMMQVISDPSFEYNFTRASYSPVWNYFWNNMPRIRTKTFLLILQKNNWLTRANQVRDDVWNRLNWTQFQRAWSWSSTFNMLMIESNYHIQQKVLPS